MAHEAEMESGNLTDIEIPELIIEQTKRWFVKPDFVIWTDLINSGG